MSKSSPKKSYEFTDEDRRVSAEIRKQRQLYQLEQMEMERQNMRLQIELKNAEIRSRIAEFLPEGEEEDGLAMELFKPIINATLGGMTGNFSPTPNSNSPPKVPSREPLSEDKIKDIYDSLPKAAKKYARNAPEETLKTFALQQIPDLSQEELTKVVKVCREN